MRSLSKGGSHNPSKERSNDKINKLDLKCKISLKGQINQSSNFIGHVIAKDKRVMVWGVQSLDYKNLIFLENQAPDCGYVKDYRSSDCNNMILSENKHEPGHIGRSTKS